jgi:hypothetical protein
MRYSVLALACLVALPVSASAADGVMQQWKAYAQSAATPDFSWAETVAVRVPSVLDGRRASLVDDTVTGTVIALTSLGQVRFARSEGHFGMQGNGDSVQLRQSLSPLSAHYAATSLVTPLGQDSVFSLTAIIANQRYATQGFGNTVWESEAQRIGVAIGGASETAYGSGVRLGLDRAVADSIDWSLSLQSRLEMDAFKSYRGVFSEPGDFDVPGFVQTGMRWSPDARTQISFEAQRIFYSDVQAFTSSALPVPLLALLGDGGTPRFAWRDLTVYSVETARETSHGGRWSLRYSTQQQPRPSSAILDRALSSLYSDTNFTLGFQQRLGAFGRLQFAASYSPISYFLAAAPYVQRTFDGGPQVEFEAHWIVPF